MRRAALVLLLAAVAGCGGDSGAPAPVTDKDRYLAKAEAVCTTANEELAKVKASQPTSSDLLPAFVKSVVDVARRNVMQLAALTPPADDAPDITAKVITPLQQQVAVGDTYTAKVTKAVKDKDPGLLGLIASPPTETKADLAFMRDYGFEACVKAADTANS